MHYLPEYYTEDQWSYDFLKSQGIVQIDTSAPAARQDVRTDTRNGILAPVSKTIELGKKLAVYRAGITARAFQASLTRFGNRD